MQPSTIFTVLAAVMAANALPNYPEKTKTKTVTATATPTSSPGQVCGQTQKQACCNSANDVAVLGSQCDLLDVLGGTCSGSVQCCETNQNGEINLISLCVPIQL